MNCRLCRLDIKNPEVLLGVISPWLREITKVSKRKTKLIICSECTGAAFSVTYDDIQMNNLYSGYREENYTNLRKKWENWYTQGYNSGHEDESFISQRKLKIKEFVTECGVTDVKSVLDIGGDRGQYIPNFESLERMFVLEKSNRLLAQDVVRIEKLDEIENVDLVIYAHILEHVNDPLKEIRDLLNISKYIYIEIPYGVPAPSKFRKSSLFQLLVLGVSCFPKLWSKLSMPAAGRLGSSLILRQSEHLNFFTVKSIQTLANTLNLKSQIKVCEIPTPDRNTARVIQVFIWQNLHD